MDAFGQFLSNEVETIMRAVAEAAPERLPAVLLVAYDIALELLGQTLAGPRARSRMVSQVWGALVPCYADLLARHPAEVLGTLTNAAVHLESINGVRTGQWLDQMAALAPHITDVAELKAAGQLLAWRAGAAHFRLGALDAAAALPEHLALAALGVQGQPDWPALLARLRDDPWHDDAEGAREVGSFTGFGGEFSVPPEVRAYPDGFLVKCEERYFLLVADARGAVLHPASADEYAAALAHAQPADFQFDGTRLRVGKREAALDLPAGELRVCQNAHTIAVSSPYTHSIRLLPR